MIGKNYSICPDSRAFITAAGITDLNQIHAVSLLVSQLKDYNLWTKMKAVYPFVGGTADSHKYNLKDPRDLDVSFRLTFYGGITHSATGVLPNGSTGYGDSHLIPNTVLSLQNTHLSYYSRTNISEAKQDIGVLESASTRFLMVCGYNTNTFASHQYDSSNGRISTTIENSLGFFIGSRTASTYHAIYKNSVKLNSNTLSGGSLPVYSVFLFSNNSTGSPAYYSSKECAFASIGDGLTDIDALNLNNIVQQYQNNLNRAI